MSRPTFLQAFLIIISGALLAFFGCLGALSTMGRTSSWSVAGTLGAIGFVVGVLMLVGGVLTLAFLTLRAIVRASQGKSANDP